MLIFLSKKIVLILHNSMSLLVLIIKTRLKIVLFVEINDFHEFYNKTIASVIFAQICVKKNRK